MFSTLESNWWRFILCWSSSETNCWLKPCGFFSDWSENIFMSNQLFFIFVLEVAARSRSKIKPVNVWCWLTVAVEVNTPVFVKKWEFRQATTYSLLTNTITQWLHTANWYYSHLNKTFYTTKDKFLSPLLNTPRGRRPYLSILLCISCFWTILYYLRLCFRSNLHLLSDKVWNKHQ